MPLPEPVAVTEPLGGALATAFRTMLTISASTRNTPQPAPIQSSSFLFFFMTSSPFFLYCSQLGLLISILTDGP